MEDSHDIPPPRNSSEQEVNQRDSINSKQSSILEQLETLDIKENKLEPVQELTPLSNHDVPQPPMSVPSLPPHMNMRPPIYYPNNVPPRPMYYGRPSMPRPYHPQFYRSPVPPQRINPHGYYAPLPRPPVQMPPNFHPPRPVVPVAVPPSVSHVLHNDDTMSVRSYAESSAGTSIIVKEVLRVENESIESLRQRAKKSNDPKLHLELARQIITIADEFPKKNTDMEPKKAKKNQDLLYQEALKWIKKGTTGPGVGKAGDPDALFLLADCYGNGSLGVSIDHDKAFSLYLQAAKQSHPSATYRAAVCYEVGAGTKRDFPRAVQYCRKAAALGDTAAMFKLGMILLNGLLGQQENPREGVTWLKRAASQADETTPHALHELAGLYEGKKDLGNVIVPDPSYAHDLYVRSAQLGYAPSQYKLGLCYEYGQLNLPVDPRRSIGWYTKSAQQGDPEAELALSGWYLTGSEGILAQSDEEAYLWARKAADKGLAKAEYAVGYFTENGIGTQPDLDEGRRWYMRAAGQGNKRAIQRLREINSYGYGQRNNGRNFRSEADAKQGECRVM